MKLKGYKKIIVAIMLMLIVLPVFSNTVDAKINQGYYDEIKQTATVSSSMLSSILSSDILIDPLAKLVYSVGNFMEYIVGAVVLAASGDNIFPWADAIVFNAIPMLDVNFISPASNSFAGGLQSVLQGIYSSLFTLAELFFGIAVLLMGIKLAVSSIAAEKAKYKDALVRWVIGLVLLFGMQFFISFVFYLNEQLVEVASDIAADELQGSQFIAQLDAINNSIPDDEITQNFVASLSESNIIDWLNRIGSFGGYDLGLWIGDQLSSVITGSMTKDQAIAVLQANPKITAALLRDSEFREVTGLNSALADGKDDNIFSWQTQSTGRVFLKEMAEVVKKVANSDLDELEELYSNAAQAYNQNPTDTKTKNTLVIAKSMYNAYLYEREGASSVQTKSIITSLASYFKTAAWAYEDGGWKPTKAVLENAILYAILVVQSVILLIAYIKRLFYIIILALMAPVVVVYDFAKKLI